MTSDNFERLWALGYRTLIPIVPPNAPISEGSTLFRRIGTHQDGRGKVPGIKGRGGNWFSFDWVPYQTDEYDLTRWGRMGAGVGIRAGLQPDGQTLVLIDADATNEDHARIIRDAIAERLGETLPIRVGRYPKAGYLCRVSGRYQYTRIEFGERDAKGNCDRVEILSDGRQFVADGIHPKTMQPYTWPRPIVPFDDLPVFTPEDMDGLLTDLTQRLPLAAPKLIKEGSAGDVNQLALRGDVEMIRRAVAATPNTTTHFPSRESYRDYGYAIKSALRDDEPEAFSIFADWCDRWIDTEHGRTNDPAVYEEDWRRMKPPFKVGASYVYEKAEKLSDGAFTRADVWFKPEAHATGAGAETIFDIAAANDPTPPTPPLRAGKVSLADLDILPPRQWLYGSKILRKYTAFLAAPGGVGKTAYTIAMMLACAANRQLLHDQPRAGRALNVWMINLEDDIVEMRRRLKAALLHYGLGDETLAHVRLNSGRDRGIKIVKLGDGGDFIVQPDYEMLIDEMQAEKIDLLIVDPFLRSHGVPENDNGAQDEVMRLFAQIAEETDAAVVLVHHTKKGAIAGDLDSMRGGSTQGGGARSAYTLAPMSSEEAVRVGVPEEERRLYVRVDDAKSNMAPPLARTEWLRLVGVPLGNGDEVYSAGDNVQVATPWSLPDAWDGVGEHEAGILAAIDAGKPDGERYSARAQDSSRWAGDLLIERADRSPEQAKEILKAWEREGRIETREYMSPAQRKLRKGLYVKAVTASAIFD